MAPEQRPTILLVEDDPGLARVARTRLERAGYAVETAATADEGMDRVGRAGVDLLILDQQLPAGESGLDLYHRVKAAGLDVPAILATGFSDEALLVQALRVGVRDFVPKSGDYLNHLTAAVARVLKQVRTERELAESRARARQALVRQQELEAEINERKRAESERDRLMRELDAERARLESVLRHMPAGVFLAEAPSGRLTYANEASARICGRPFDPAAPGERPRAFLPDGSPLPEEAYPLMRAIRNGEAVHRQEMRIERGDGGRRTISANAAPIRDASGTVVAAVMAFHDIEDQKRAQDALKEADRRKDEFLAMLAHELRNPLAPLRTALEIVKAANASPDQLRRTREVMERQVQVMARLVDDLLDVSRISRGKIDLRKGPIDLRTVAAQAVETARPLIEARRHALTMDLPSEALPLDGDGMRLGQVVANLLNNAAKYQEPGGRIRLTAGREGGEVVLRVYDAGVGIAAEMLPRVFELFVQADHPPSLSQGGLGIGLTLVKRLVEMHGGRVEVHSAGPGQGSEFVVHLPALPEAAGSGPQPDAAGADEVVRACRVLVVDDNADSAEVLASLLRMWGHEVRTAHDGSQALAAARVFRPDVAVLDVAMPDMNGYETARRLRDEGGLDQTAFVALTGYSQDADRHRSVEAGFRAHLVKPVDPQTVRELLANLAGNGDEPRGDEGGES